MKRELKILSILRVVVLVLVGGTPFARGQFVPLDQNVQIWGGALGATSGTSLKFPDTKGTVTENFEVLISGTAPASTTINVYGCMRGDTCSSSLANTTSTSSVLIAPSTNALYDYYKATVSWTGGDSTTKITINRSGTVAKTGGGAGGAGVSSINTVAGAFTFSGTAVSCTSTTCTFSSGSGLPAGTGMVRVDSGTGSAAELSGDVTTSASNAVTVKKINGVAMSGLATGIVKNTTGTGVPSIAAAGTDYVAPGGALGTPSSGVVTNLTGTFSGTVAGTSACVPGSFASQTDGATVTWAIASAMCANASLTFTVHSGSRTLNLTGLVTGGSYVLWIKQDATGGEGLTLGTGCTWKVSGGGAGAITPSVAASAIDVLAFTYDGTNCYLNFTKNFS